MSQYTIQDVRKADELWDTMPLTQVSGEMDIPYSTLSHWSAKGWISTSRDWKAEKTHPHAHDRSMHRRASRLWERMPLTEVAEVLDIPYNTLQDWSAKGLISTSKDWRVRYRTRQAERRKKEAVDLVIRKGLKQSEAAERMGLSESSISNYIRDFKSS